MAHIFFLCSAFEELYDILNWMNSMSTYHQNDSSATNSEHIQSTMYISNTSFSAETGFRSLCHWETVSVFERMKALWKDHVVVQSSMSWKPWCATYGSADNRLQPAFLMGHHWKSHHIAYWKMAFQPRAIKRETPQCDDLGGRLP